MYKRSLQPNAVIPRPESNGWKMDSKEKLLINWMNQPSAPDSVMELANCTASCKKSGCNDASKCSCLENKILCTELCKCARLNCSNVGGQQEDEEPYITPMACCLFRPNRKPICYTETINQGDEI